MSSPQELENWFEENKRNFPWRENPTPYRVWISEVMLQQTRASVVIPYFNKWMELFPNVKALYMASVDEVIKAWEGLGFYSRARNIHKAAAQIVENFGGKIPETYKELISIRGFGPYTVGAILSFAYQKRATAIDGNVIRVITRFFRIEEDVAKASTKKKIEEKTEELLHEEIPWITSEALIELGALVCVPKQPKCKICPLKNKCLGKEIAEDLPVKKKESPLIHLYRQVHVIEWKGHLLVRKGEKGKVMEDLYEFPYIEGPKTKMMRFSNGEPLKACSHTFTKYKAHLFPFFIRKKEKSKGRWVEISKIWELPFSSGHRKILTELIKTDKIST